MLLMCGQDPLVAVRHDGSSWSKASKIGILELNMLGAQLDAAADRYGTWDEVFFLFSLSLFFLMVPTHTRGRVFPK